MWDTTNASTGNKQKPEEKIQEKEVPKKFGINFDIDKKTRHEYQKIYERQLTALGTKINTETDLLHMLTIGYATSLYISSI